MGSGPLGDHRFTGYRRRLIEEVRGRGIDDLEILQLFDQVPRHLFMPEGVWNRAYEDAPIPIGYHQTASQPSLQALFLSILKPRETERVLEIGTGSGFLTALLAGMAERVYSVERIRELSARARKALDDLGIMNVALLVGDGTIGWRKYAPYDVIVVSAASPSIPKAYVDQLADPGRMLIPIGSKDAQDLILVEKVGFAVTQQPVKAGCTFVPLLGRFAWKEEVPG
ncbi:MAG: protein-L-isoaspartate(D-aspartate) O-methyltransferase, partial [Gemmatimonadetes bacterium]|nr:protein-L-isoaspartate(D-aspartate) O-methyltransferase [Gemmatimonadota bacterium]